jgi:hypothetical protein
VSSDVAGVALDHRADGGAVGNGGHGSRRLHTLQVLHSAGGSIRDLGAAPMLWVPQPGCATTDAIITMSSTPLSTPLTSAFALPRKAAEESEFAARCDDVSATWRATLAAFRERVVVGRTHLKRSRHSGGAAKCRRASVFIAAYIGTAAAAVVIVGRFMSPRRDHSGTTTSWGVEQGRAAYVRAGLQRLVLLTADSWWFWVAIVQFTAELLVFLLCLCVVRWPGSRPLGRDRDEREASRCGKLPVPVPVVEPCTGNVKAGTGSASGGDVRVPTVGVASTTPASTSRSIRSSPCRSPASYASEASLLSPLPSPPMWRTASSQLSSTSESSPSPSASPVPFPSPIINPLTTRTRAKMPTAGLPPQPASGLSRTGSWRRAALDVNRDSESAHGGLRTPVRRHDDVGEAPAISRTPPAFAAGENDEQRRRLVQVCCAVVVSCSLCCYQCNSLVPRSLQFAFVCHCQ